MDLVPPLDGHFHRANIAVPISRPSGLDDVHPLLLWSNEAGQARVLMAYIKALAPNPDRVADNAQGALLAAQHPACLHPIPT